MEDLTVHMTGLPSGLRDSIAAAVENAFPGAGISGARTVAQALAAAPAERELVILGDEVGEGEAARALQASDAAGLPRWAVVGIGDKAAAILDSTVGSGCDPSALASILRSSVLQHELLCDNLRLRGDLKTIARRISHDLYTPLNCIHMTCEALAEAPPGDVEGLHSKTASIHEMLVETRRLIERVSHLLTASSERPSLEVVAMGPIVASVLQQLEPAVRTSGASIRQPEEWPLVSGVAAWLEVIWSNLIGNALEHGQAPVAVELGWSLHDGAGRFWVADTGPGVPDSQKPRLFQRFESLHQTPSRGLGLSFVQRLVTLQGGDCGYERRDGKASLFYFTLPQAGSLRRRELLAGRPARERAAQTVR